MEQHVKRRSLLSRRLHRALPKEDLTNQLTSEFASHLSRDLTTGPLNTLLIDRLSTSLTANVAAQGDRLLVAEAVQTVAAEIALELVEEYPRRLAKKLAVTPKQSPPPPHTSTEYHDYISDFIREKKLTKLYNPDDQYIKNLAEKAANQAEKMATKFGLPPDITPGLVKLALYDFVILCDDSSSMTLENRIWALKDTLRRVADFATILTPEGISVRFLNHRDDDNGQFDNLKTVAEIERRIASVEFDGDTRLGERLDSKIVQPMIIQKAAAEILTKPVIVVLITDGEPTNEPRESLRNTILNCKMSNALRIYGDTAVAFLISRVGNSEDARIFLDELRRDKKIGGMVYCSPEDMEEKRAIFQKWLGLNSEEEKEKKKEKEKK